MSLSRNRLNESWPQFVDFYAHLTHHIIPGPNSGCYFLPFILLPGALLVPPAVLSHNQLARTVLPVIYACQIHAWATAGMDVISVNLALWAFVLLVLRDPRATHRRLRVVNLPPGDENRKDGSRATKLDEKLCTEEPYPEHMRKRIPWVLTLLVSLRLTGWRIGERSHDIWQPPMWHSRTQFLKHAIRTSLLGYIILDVTSWYAQTDPYFHTSNMVIDAAFPPPNFNMPTAIVILRLLPPRLLRSSVLAGQVFATVRCMFYLPVIPVIGLNSIGLWPDEWSPHTWPIFFGDFSAIQDRGLRGLWGSWWHQLNRHITATPGRSLAQISGVPTNSFLGYAMLTISAFFLSGIMHMGMIPPEPKSELLSAVMMRLYVGGFFWAQIFGFGVEIAVEKAVRRFAPVVAALSVTRIMILVWVASWLAVTLPLLTVPFREIGYWHYHAIPFSIVRKLEGKGWTTWPILKSYI